MGYRRGKNPFDLKSRRYSGPTFSLGTCSHAEIGEFWRRVGSHAKASLKKLNSETLRAAKLAAPYEQSWQTSLNHRARPVASAAFLLRLFGNESIDSTATDKRHTWVKQIRLGFETNELVLDGPYLRHQDAQVVKDAFEAYVNQSLRNLFDEHQNANAIDADWRDPATPRGRDRGVFLLTEYLAQCTETLNRTIDRYTELGLLRDPEYASLPIQLYLKPSPYQFAVCWWELAQSTRDTVRITNKTQKWSNRVEGLRQPAAAQWVIEFDRWHLDVTNLVGMASHWHTTGTAVKPDLYCGNLLTQWYPNDLTSLKQLKERAKTLRSGLERALAPASKTTRYCTTHEIVTATRGHITAKMLDNKRSSLMPRPISGTSRTLEWPLERVISAFGNCRRSLERLKHAR